MSLFYLCHYLLYSMRVVNVHAYLKYAWLGQYKYYYMLHGYTGILGLQAMRAGFVIRPGKG